MEVAKHGLDRSDGDGQPQGSLVPVSPEFDRDRRIEHRFTQGPAVPQGESGFPGQCRLHLRAFAMVIHEGVVLIGIGQYPPVAVDHCDPGGGPAAGLADKVLQGLLLPAAEGGDGRLDQQRPLSDLLLETIDVEVMTGGGRQPADHEHGGNGDADAGGKDLPEQTDVAHG